MPSMGAAPTNHLFIILKTHAVAPFPFHPLIHPPRSGSSYSSHSPFRLDKAIVIVEDRIPTPSTPVTPPVATLIRKE